MLATANANGRQVASGLSYELAVERSVLQRYANAAREVEPGLCCPSERYESALLANLPAEIVAKDYGCGDPTKYVEHGESVVDLGSGSGKACFLISQRVGSTGSVVGVDFNDSMLHLAKRYEPEIAERIGFSNVRFVKARIQDMALNLERVEELLRNQPPSTLEQWNAFEEECDRLRQEEPAVASEFANVVVSNCVLNLVRADEKVRLFADIHRVLKRGGRAVISDIVCDEDPTPAIMNDPELWSGCISGAFREDRFLEQFEAAGFYGVEIVARQEKPWQVIDGIEFRSVTVRAFKGKEGPCLERNQAVIYRGPWKSVRDDDGHTLHRGQRMAVCDKTYRILTQPDGPYAGHVLAVPPMTEVPLDEAELFDCKGAVLRELRVTKGQNDRATKVVSGSPCCEGGSCC